MPRPPLRGLPARGLDPGLAASTPNEKRRPTLRLWPETERAAA